MHSQEQVDNLREVQALKRLNPHPNVVKLIEVILYVSVHDSIQCADYVTVSPRGRLLI